MKKTIFAAILALLAVCIAATAHAQLISGPNLNATLLYYEPVPASPGSTLDVYVQIINTGESARQVSVEFIDNYPFSVESSADRVKLIQSIPGQESSLIKYRVRVSQDASPGTSSLKLRYSVAGAVNSQTTLLPIDIGTNSISVNVEQVKLDPEYLVPGSVGKLTFLLHNAAPIKIRDGSVTLDLGGLDIVPVGSTNQKPFTDLQAGQDMQFSFQLSASPELAPGIYKIPINLSFNDQQGRSYQRAQYIGVRVGAKPDISLVVDDSKLTTDVTSGEVLLRVTNKGLGEVKFVNLELVPSPSYDLDAGSEQRYVGNIDSDDYKTARVLITANEDEVTMPVKVTYMDALNTPYTMEETLHIPLRNPSGGGVSWPIIVGALVVLGIIGFLFLRRRGPKSR